MELNYRPNVWILKSKGAESAFGGNEGYADQINSHYVYDTNVKNHDKISVTDLVIITGKRNIEGFARIEQIETEKAVQKKRFRCPICNSQEHYERKKISPKFKCRNKHTFDEPIEEPIVVDQFTAVYNSTFVLAPPNTSAKKLDGYYVRRNRYYSIQLAKLDFFSREFPDVIKLLSEIAVGQSAPSSNQLSSNLPLSEYQPFYLDTRNLKVRKIVSRQGQQLFRETLFRIYGVRCMLTGCGVSEAIEASHINPYRGENDNHPGNGLLLRRDLHAIFDADLIGIDPETLQVSLHPALLNSEYKVFANKKLDLTRTDFSPSRDALSIRWKIFAGSLPD